MRVAIVGAGPAGLYMAILMKRLRPRLDIAIFDQNPPGATFGFGVVFSDDALAFLRRDDPQTADLIEPAMTRWSDIHVCHRGETVVIDGVGFAGIGRLELLELLRRRAAELGIQPRHETRVDDIEALEADLIVGADGLNSRVRASGDFGERIALQKNVFVWYGAAREFPALTQSFVETRFGPMNAHHYSYAPGRATFIVEMGPETFARAGFETMAEPAYRAACQEAFAEVLGGAALIANNSVWRRFPHLSCARWHDGNRVLMGDALHTAHFSIGSGTRLALEDGIALAAALRDSDWDVVRALPAYHDARAPILDKIVAAARRSADWYDDFADHMALDPWPFALSYIRRAGRVNAKRLRAMAPAFTSGLDARAIALEDAP